MSMNNCGRSQMNGRNQQRSNGYRNTMNVRNMNEDMKYECSCGMARKPEHEDRLAGMALAMSYVPWQQFRKLYNEEEALCKGTIFKELDLEFERGCVR